MANDYDLVTLEGGLIIPLKALQLVWGLEDRGIDLELDRDAIIVRPKGVLSDEDHDQIRQLRPHIVALITFCERGSHATDFPKVPCNTNHERTVPVM